MCLRFSFVDVWRKNEATKHPKAAKMVHCLGKRISM
jgi:hypothetical protein